MYVRDISKISKRLLKWDSFNRDHIKKHNVTIKEIEQLILDNKKIIQKAKRDRYHIIGISGKRMLSAFISEEQNKFYVVTCRDASTKERKLYYLKNKNGKEQ